MGEIEQMQRWMEGKSDALFLETMQARRYLTGFASDDGVLCILPDRAILFVDGRFYEAAQQQAHGCEVILLEPRRGFLKEVLLSCHINSMMVETALSIAAFERYRTMLAPIEVQADERLDQQIASLRMIKDDKEAAAIRAAQEIADAAFSNILDFVRPGVTEREIAAQLEYEMRKKGSQRQSFDTIAITGPNTSLPHGVPGDRPVQEGDFVTMDFGAVVDCYHSDMTRTVAIGYVSEEMERVYQLVLKAQNTVLWQLRAGFPCRKGDEVAREIIKAEGYGDYFVHSTGHGVGLDIHEAPNLSSGQTGDLQIGHVVTVEPGIYLPGRFGVRIEDFVMITEKGCENFVKSEKQLIIL